MDRSRLIGELIRDEDEQLRLYRCPAGRLTIGVGHNIEDRGISRAASRFILAEDIAEVEAGLDQTLPWWRGLDESRQRALANMGFNLGVRKLLTFKNTLFLVQAGRYAEAADAMLASKWAEQVGPRARRLAELMRRGDPDDGGVA